jgi:uncharacterized SAM-binding protein YcdF (DUF218 family)
MQFFLFKRQFVFIFLTALIVILLVTIPLRLAIATCQSPRPQAILTLGGTPEREQFTAKFAQTYPDLPIWISSGSTPEKVREIFRNAGTTEANLHIDRRAVDTVTNFTTLVKDFQKEHIQHLYLITSCSHMPRAKAIAIIVLGSHGIAFTPICLHSWGNPESKVRIWRDVGRAFFWLMTGRTGASLKTSL